MALVSIEVPESAVAALGSVKYVDEYAVAELLRDPLEEAGHDLIGIAQGTCMPDPHEVRRLALRPAGFADALEGA